MNQDYAIKLVALSGPLAGHDWEFDQDVITIGRSETNDVPLVDDTTVSRSHATLRRVNGDWELRDDNSANGTHVLDAKGRRRLDKPERFSSTRRFFFGSSQVECRVRDGAEPPADPPAQGRTQLILQKSMHLSIALQAGDLVFRATKFDASVSEYRTPYAAQAIRDAIDAATASIIAVPPDSNSGDSASDRKRALEKLGDDIAHLAFPARIREAVQEATEPYLILAVDHELLHVPWELARFNYKPLMLGFSVGRQVVFRDPSAIRQPPTHVPMAPAYILLVANPLDNQPRLQRHAEEVMNMLRRRLPDTNVELLSGERVIKREVIARMTDADIVYYAGPEARETPNRETTAWQTADGQLGALDLRPLTKVPALVMSAICAAPRSDDDPEEGGMVLSGTSEMSARFIAAGTRNTVTSFWPSSVDSATAFANATIEGLLEGDAIGGVVRAARETTIEKFGSIDPSPYSYVLYGDPTIAPVVC